MDETIWTDLLNSDWHDHRGTGKHEDRLENPDWLRGYLKRWNISLPGVPEEELKKFLHSLRTLLRRIAEQAAAEKTTSPELLVSLNRYFDQAPLTRRLTYEKKRPRLKLEPAAGKLASALGSIAGAFAEALTNNEPPRIKICQNKDCGWVFYDRSKNRSRKWCEQATCANLMKVRRFRQRHRQKG